MPSIEQSLISKINLSGLVPVTNNPSIQPIQEKVQRNMFHRCPVPPTGSISPDILSQGNLHGALPQFRVFTKNG